MDKGQAIQNFWSGFGLTAYDQNSVPDNTPMPYITYTVETGSIGNVLTLTGSLWYHSNSWKEIQRKADEIGRYIGEHGHKLLKIDNGYILLAQGSPFAQRLADDDNTIRRIYINISAEYLTAY